MIHCCTGLVSLPVRKTASKAAHGPGLVSPSATLCSDLSKPTLEISFRL